MNKTTLLGQPVSKIVVETDEKDPVTIAEITDEAVDVAEGYRVRVTPIYD